MEPAFAGDLGLLGLFDLGQLLRMNGATGVLAISHEGRRGALWFDAGRIVNALDENRREGEEAAYRLFTWTRGRFEFRPEPVATSALIEVGTEALMMEAARLMDEAGGTTGESGATGRLLEHQQQFQALREAFASLAHEARTAGASAAEAAAAELGALRRAGDLLLLRPGRPARLRIHGAWRVAREAALDDAEYAQLRSRLLGAADSAAGDTVSVEIEHTEGRRLHVTRIGQGPRESLWVRPTRLPAPAAVHLIAPPEQMALLLETDRGLVLIGADDPADGARALHAMVAARLEQQPETLVLATERGLYRHKDGAGVLVETTGAALADALAHAAPDTVALDGLPPAGALARRLGATRLMIARVPAEPGAQLLEVFRHSLDPADRGTLDQWLQGRRVVLVAALRPGPDEATLPFNAWEAGSPPPARLDRAA